MVVFVFEGLPGTGKTSLVADLSKHLGFLKVGEVINEAGKEISSPPKRREDQSFFFENDLRKYRIAKKLSENGIVLMDRGYLSTIGYNLCFNNLTHQKKVLLLEKKFGAKYAEEFICVYVKISPQLSLKRKKEYNENPLNLWSFLENLKKISNFYDDRLLNNKKTIVIDGSTDYPELYDKTRELILNYDFSREVKL